ncbi:hypothetical protein E4U13_000944 [Claviceps humidiphila]|uniref:Protamine P1 n=1 Tax=Claviceps humidiphila TaxID=1294629 RepID=A0A9P7TVK1_9HYPO|nr:hypothetical protein E4U13_000944 [Claviceps humidiphila]
MTAKTNEDWSGGDDFIYYESYCERQDIFYEGSDDEEYQCPSERRLRYEAAGQRFLNGQIPTLISASLEGPFDSATGWTNPWTSKRNKAVVTKTKDRTRSEQRASQRSSTKVHRTQQSTFLPSAGECHLPSPESLKQAPQSQDCSFLRTEKLATVKRWQEKLDNAPSDHDSFWDGDKSNLSPSVKKRRASGAEWLKNAPLKRHKSGVKTRRGKRSSQDNDVDELMSGVPSASFDHAKPYTSPSTRRQLSNPGSRCSSIKTTEESDDELSLKKAAAATLSSPVSLQNASGMESCNDSKIPFGDVLSSASAQSTPSRLRHVKRNRQVLDKEDFHQDLSIDDDGTGREAKGGSPETSELPMPECTRGASAETEQESNDNSTRESGRDGSLRTSQSFAMDLEKTDNSDRCVSSLGENDTAGSSPSPSGSGSQEISKSSFRYILSRFVPSSPWKRLSQLASSGSSPSASQAPCSQQDNFTVAPATSPDSKSADKPVIEEIANSTSESSCVDGEDDNSEESTSQAHTSDCGNLHDEQSALETVHRQASISLGGNTQDAGSNSLVSASQQSPWTNSDELVTISASQQSPWAKSDEFVVSEQHVSTLKSTPSKRVLQDDNVMTSQSPWVSHTEPSIQAANPYSKESITPERSANNRAARLRFTTPEPQFCFKPFASFMSPSPGRSRGEFSSRSTSKVTARGCQGSLTSVLKRNSSSRRGAKHRVSWAAPLTDLDSSPFMDHETETITSTEVPRRQRSPPPEAPIADLAKHCDEKFSKHFEAIASRQENEKSCLLADRPIVSTEPPTVAGALSEAGAAFYDDDKNDDKTDIPQGTLDVDDDAGRSTCDRDSEEPLDMMEDMVREMGDFWDPWNIDAELEHARKNESKLLVGVP